MENSFTERTNHGVSRNSADILQSMQLNRAEISIYRRLRELAYGRGIMQSTIILEGTNPVKEKWGHLGGTQALDFNGFHQIGSRSVANFQGKLG